MYIRLIQQQQQQHFDNDNNNTQYPRTFIFYMRCSSFIVMLLLF